MRQVLVLFLAVAFALSFAGLAAAQATAPGSGQKGSEPAKAPASDPSKAPAGSATDPSKPSTTTTAPGSSTTPSPSAGTDPSKSKAAAGAKPAATAAARGQHKMMGEVTKIDAAKGMLSVKTAEGDMDLHFPPSALQGIKEGDRVEVQLAIRPAGATSAATPSAGKAPGAAKSGDPTKPKTQ